MKVVRTKLGENGQIVIPTEYLQVLGLEVGDTSLYARMGYKKGTGGGMPLYPGGSLTE
jgi:bifunctional DNA-binding transcriptional regulator/antitoxin component of YhaV-PrlF toxin-antitoxin module